METFSLMNQGVVVTDEGMILFEGLIKSFEEAMPEFVEHGKVK